MGLAMTGRIRIFVVARRCRAATRDGKDQGKQRHHSQHGFPLKVDRTHKRR
jgi:hypothetical protein